jgi:hypothetical protein
MPLTDKLSFEALVKQELYFAREAHQPRPYRTLEIAFMDLQSRMDELQNELREDPRLRDEVKLVTSLANMSAICQRACEDLNLLES